MDSAVAIITAIFASGGLWSLIQTMVTLRAKKKEAKESDSCKAGRLLLGLAYDRICQSGRFYIKRGWLTLDEREDFRKYLFIPYHEYGGDGTAESIMSEMDKLPLIPPDEKNEAEAT